MNLDNLHSYPNPPQDAVARGFIASDGEHRIHVIAMSRTMVEADALARIVGRELTVIPEMLVAASPGFYGMTTFVDQRVMQQEKLALTTEVPGYYQLTTSIDLGLAENDFKIADFTVPLGEEATPEDPAGDDSEIGAAVTNLTDRVLRKRLDETLSIPPLPEAARRIVALSHREDIDPLELVDIIETDPSLAARIVGWANSAYYGGSRTIYSVHDAIVRVLGTEFVMNMALGLALGETLRLPSSHVRGVSDYWLTAVFNAATAETIARRTQDVTPGLAYLAGLLSNFGTLVVGHVFPPYYERICRLQEHNRHLDHAWIDRHVLATNRELLAARLLELWELPQEVVDAVRFQYVRNYEGENDAYPKILRLVHQTLAAEGVNDYPPNWVDDELARLIGVDATSMEEVVQFVTGARDELDGLAQTIAR